ncbi:MAG: hypothetical protein KDB27_16345 [Planctomycetales bacterium]|nr:hypothetical protein [Planctomycetales bacterium]
MTLRIDYKKLQQIVLSMAPPGQATFRFVGEIAVHPVFRKGKLNMVRPLRKCEVCRGWIAPERVATIPRSRLCIEHAQRIDSFGGEFKVQFYHERISKAGSLKVNYGGIVTRLVRNQPAMERLIEWYEAEAFGSFQPAAEAALR